MLLPGTILLSCATLATAQRHGGGAPATGEGGLSAYSRPDGVSEKDSLQDFHHALAVQATSQQIAEFQQVIQSTDAAKANLRLLAAAAANTGREAVAVFEQSLEDARARNRKFQDGFSEPQKSGLKEITKRLEKIDSDLEQEAKRLDQTMQAGTPVSDASAYTASFDKTLTDFSSEQLALGREMSIVRASGQDLVFNLPKIRNHVDIGARSISVDFSGVLSQTASQGDQRAFTLQSILDLSELQQTITEIINSQLDRNACGARLVAKQAILVAATPASSVVLQLHYERWSCSRTFGQTELAESEGTVEITLTPSIDKSGTIALTPAFKRIAAAGMMADDLRSGDLGDTLRDKVSSSVLRALQGGADFKTTLPGALQNDVILSSARFEDPSGSGLKAFLEGHVRLSNDQVNLLASQLNQTLSAQGIPAPAPAPATTPAQPTK